jgi:cytochrome b561
MMTRRTLIKWLHWLSAFLILYFFLVEPEDVERMGAVALATHSGVGMVLAVVALIWISDYLRRGLAGRAGPKLPGWGKRFHGIVHRVLYYGLPATVLTGGLAGLAAPYVIKAFGVIPITFGAGTKNLHELAEELHELAFDALLIVIIAHTAFHVWRHVWLKDNALRIMAPERLHRYL